MTRADQSRLIWNFTYTLLNMKVIKSHKQFNDVFFELRSVYEVNTYKLF